MIGAIVAICSLTLGILGAWGIFAGWDWVEDWLADRAEARKGKA